MKHLRLSSTSNPLVRNAMALKEARERRKQQACLVVGEKALAEAQEAGCTIQHLFFRDDILNPETYAGNTPWVLATAPILKNLGETQSPAPVVAIVALPEHWNNTGLNNLPEPNHSEDTLLVLDGIQDPGNLGTLLRSACAFGVNRILIIEPAADAFSPKALRSATGLQFRLNLHRVAGKTSVDVLSHLRSSGWHITLADMLEDTETTPYEDESLAHAQQQFLHTAPLPIHPTALVLGQEGQGLRLNPLDRQRFNRLAVGMVPGVDSLNVAVTGSIILHQWYTQRLRDRTNDE